mgnify:CR=1 FL=1
MGSNRRVWKHMHPSRRSSMIFLICIYMSDVNGYGVHCVAHLGERPIVCVMVNNTKRRIILENSWVYLKGTQCFVSEDHVISQKSVCYKGYEEKWKNKVKDVAKHEMIGK